MNLPSVFNLKSYILVSSWKREPGKFQFFLSLVVFCYWATTLQWLSSNSQTLPSRFLFMFHRHLSGWRAKVNQPFVFNVHVCILFRGLLNILLWQHWLVQMSDIPTLHVNVCSQIVRFWHWDVCPHKSRESLLNYLYLTFISDVVRYCYSHDKWSGTNYLAFITVLQHSIK